MKRKIALIIFMSLFIAFSGCFAKESQSGSNDSETQSQDQINETGEKDMKSLQLYINDVLVTVSWEDNESVKALAALAETAALKIDMSMYGGFEQVGSLGKSLPRNDSQITTEAGDIVLYSSNQIVVFYGSNSWSYTRLGRITDKNAEQLKEILGKSNVKITITAE